MFFSHRIRSIKPSDRVLEVGPGGSPFHRADVLLEKVFNEKDARKQRGNAQALQTDKQVVFYSGDKFPFEDNAFDYVICSHVLEHVPVEDFTVFVNELQRVAKKGYLEFPTIYYDYIYNFEKHVTMLMYHNNTIYYMPKNMLGFDNFLPIQHFLYNSSDKGYTTLIDDLKEYFFQGFEWSGSITVSQAENLDSLVYSQEVLEQIPQFDIEASCIRKLIGKMKQRLYPIYNKLRSALHGH